jgi:adenosylcobyric acid synthase
MTDHTTARTLLIAGTASHVGKSTVAAGLCRLLADRGVDVAPFKAQNMSNNARAVPRSDVMTAEDDGSTAEATTGAFGEIGVSQYVQARAARVRPTTDHNPVLLKPRGGSESQLVIDGEAVGHYAAESYYADHWERARTAALAAYDRLARSASVVVAEGAGSIAEINLHDRDLANVELARHADADILLVADIERGGVFASLVGTLELLPADLREQVRGVLITKFRGDRSLLAPGIDSFTDRTGIPVLGVLPHDDPGLPEEDSVSIPPADQRRVRGDGDGVAAEHTVTIAVPRLPRISNTTDLAPLAAVPGVRVAFVPLSSTLSEASGVLVPGTKNTVDDLQAVHAAGFDETLRAFDGPIVGLCGGYQLLGERLTNVGTEGVDATGDLPGVGLLPVSTRFDPDKRVVAATLELSGTGLLAGVECTVEGYEIHAGRTRLRAATDPANVRLPFSHPDADPTPALGVATDSVLGTYLHGLFENPPRERPSWMRCLTPPTGSDRTIRRQAPRHPTALLTFFASGPTLTRSDCDTALLPGSFLTAASEILLGNIYQRCPWSRRWPSRAAKAGRERPPQRSRSGWPSPRSTTSPSLTPIRAWPISSFTPDSRTQTSRSTICCSRTPRPTSRTLSTAATDSKSFPAALASPASRRPTRYACAL